MFRFLKKKNDVIESVNTKSVEGAEVWIVSWKARYGDFSHDVKRVAKAFLNYEDAVMFKDSLNKAKELLQYTEYLDIKIEKQQ
jgi:hypothetical protein